MAPFGLIRRQSKNVALAHDFKQILGGSCKRQLNKKTTKQLLFGFVGRFTSILYGVTAAAAAVVAAAAAVAAALLQLLGCKGVVGTASVSCPLA